MLGTGPKFPLNYDRMTIRYEEAIERARSIVPVAKKNVQLAEEMRRMPEENARAILEFRTHAADAAEDVRRL